MGRSLGAKDLFCKREGPKPLRFVNYSAQGLPHVSSRARRVECGQAHTLGHSELELVVSISNTPNAPV